MARFRAAIADPAVRIVLAEDGGALLGYLIFGGSRDFHVGLDVGEIRTFFVRPASWRTGVGSELMEVALAGLDGLGCTEATVWSFADNARANAFYERHGFARDGSERREEAWANILEVRYRRSLA